MADVRNDNEVDVALVNNTTVATGNGVVGTGVQRVAIASDNTAFAVNATLQTGSNTIGTVGANSAIAAAVPANAFYMGVSDGTNLIGLRTNAGDATSGANLLSNSFFQYNGTNWDKARNNYNTTTGDTGAKTANFTGATQTNYNAKGAIITALLGTVSGTITTFQTGLQYSYDGGTTWLQLTVLGANVTTPASGNTFIVHIYPATVTASSLGGTQVTYSNGVLPRTWRWIANIAGTTPSITITSVSVNYIL